jgi:hypothetical protein
VAAFGKKSNNQQTVSGNDGMDDGEGARLGQSVWGGFASLFRVAN